MITGGMGDTTVPALITGQSYADRLMADAEKFNAKYQQPQTFATFVVDARHYAEAATYFVSNFSAPYNRDEAARVANELIYLRDYAAQISPSSTLVRQSLKDRLINDVQGLIGLMVPAIAPIIDGSNADAALAKSFVEKTVNAPSEGLGWVLDQLRKTLSLPSWFVPVIAGAGVLGLGAWAYFTFLEPARRASSRLARVRNPRRRRRRRHR